MGLCASSASGGADDEYHKEHDISWSSSAIRDKKRVVESKIRIGSLMKEELAEHKELLHQKRAVCLTSDEVRTLTTLFQRSMDPFSKTLDKMAFLRLFMRSDDGMFGGAHDEESKHSKSGKYKKSAKKDAHKNVEQVFELFKNCDVDGNEKVDLEEFLAGVSFWKQTHQLSPKGKLLLYFRMFDTAGTGKLNRAAFACLLTHMLTINPHGEYEKDMVTKFSKSLFDSVDAKDPTRGINMKEFVAWCMAHPEIGIDGEEGAEAVFRRFDINHDNKITRDEFINLVKQRHLVTSQFDKGPIKARLDKITRKVYKSVDKDNSGSIDFDEFSEWLMEDASLGTVQSLCDVMSDVGKDLKRLQSKARGAMDMIVGVAERGVEGDGRSEAEQAERKAKEDEKKRAKDEKKQKKREEKRRRRVEEEAAAKKADVERKKSEANKDVITFANQKAPGKYSWQEETEYKRNV
jgi:Ca2+-binding EF-hand superfamily protein